MRHVFNMQSENVSRGISEEKWAFVISCPMLESLLKCNTLHREAAQTQDNRVIRYIRGGYLNSI